MTFTRRPDAVSCFALMGKIEKREWLMKCLAGGAMFAMALNCPAAAAEDRVTIGRENAHADAIDCHFTKVNLRGANGVRPHPYKPRDRTDVAASAPCRAGLDRPHRGSRQKLLRDGRLFRWLLD